MYRFMHPGARGMEKRGARMAFFRARGLVVQGLLGLEVQIAPPDDEPPRLEERLSPSSLLHSSHSWAHETVHETLQKINYIQYIHVDQCLSRT